MDDQDDRSAFNRLGSLSFVSDFNCDPVEVPDFFASTLYRVSQTAGNTRMICLDANAVVEPIAVIYSAAEEHGVLLEHSQARRRLPSVSDLRTSAIDGTDKLASDSSN